ncbi:MAG TPA: flagellar basal body L-ring protein FlgH [Candidatus Desulfofervidus auxilii]|uniref:Flagellar L-ring protein n=1 Tax=Desulfofervidus auxilii TaxID=1621989 RepID=A0A7C0Y9N9_DESA2|nr:flagellar basal body L-ring protein FlgH [Candidatus Desulfofervidus auxilii]
MKIKKLIIFLILIIGCATIHKTTQKTPSFVTPPPTDLKKHSLLLENSPQARLFSDLRAYQVGDIITIKVVETTIAYNKAETKTSRKSEVKSGISNFFGIDLTDHTSLSASAENAFEGKGETNRSEKLITTFTAQVIKVFPNGNLLVEGKRELVINNEKRIIILRGIVRPIDISRENVVLSTHIANAEIIYKGKGVVADKQKTGWFIRILDNIWPF